MWNTRRCRNRRSRSIRGARGKLVIDLPRRPGERPRFAVASEGDFGLRHEAVLDGTATTLRFAWERSFVRQMPLWDPGLGDPVLLRWRDIDVKREARRLPGGPGTLEALHTMLERLPTGAPGRDSLAAVVGDLAEARGLLDAFRARRRAYATAEAVLERARKAAEDRTGAEREEARRRLNRASLEAEQAGAAGRCDLGGVADACAGADRARRVRADGSAAARPTRRRRP
jgi:hypothetical protein